MKANTFDNIVKILILEVIALFGLRGILPDVVATGQTPLLLAAGVAVIAGFMIGQAATECEPACDPKLCRVP